MTTANPVRPKRRVRPRGRGDGPQREGASSGGRYRTHYDIDGPHVRLGIAWFTGVVVAVALGTVALAVYFALAAGAAGAHGARAWRARRHRIDRRACFALASVVPLAAAAGPQVMGLAVIVVAAVAVGLAVVTQGSAPEGTSVVGVLGSAGLVLRATLAPAVAAGCVVLAQREASWAVPTLLLLVSAYETGDYLIGSGSANVVEGPVAGLAAVAVLSVVVALIVSDFTFGQAMAFGITVGALSVVGQLLASAILPHAAARAPALRRLDSWLLAAPFWYLTTQLSGN